MADENKGHRARLRERMMKEGLASFKDHEVLELLLFQSIPRRDTNKLAHRLLDQFGSLAGVLNATPDRLMMVKGVSEVTACNLAMLKEVWRRYKASEAETVALKGFNSIVDYAKKLMAESYTERLVAVYVDHDTRYLYRDVFTSDSNDSVSVDIKRIVSTAMRTGASGVILFHCHPHGLCSPSEADMEFTEKLTFALASIELSLLEHIIFNDSGKYYSFFCNKVMEKIQQKFKAR